MWNCCTRRFRGLAFTAREIHIGEPCRQHQDNDRDGKEIFSRNVTSGNSETITGTPPLKLVIGNATGMQLTYNGSPVDLAPHIRANVARLTLE